MSQDTAVATVLVALVLFLTVRSLFREWREHHRG